MRRNSWSFRLALTAVALTLPALAAPTDDLVFIHHSVGQNWLDNGLDAALLAKGYVDERNDITYGTEVPPDPGRPDSLDPTAGDLTDMCHWIRWFNDYLAQVRAYGCADGVNRIVMFKSCFPNSDIGDDGAEPGDPFSQDRTLANYRAIFRHPNGPGNTYTDGAATYRPLEDIFAGNPDTLFIYVTAPPLRYAETTNANAHRARLFNNWLKNEWLASYNAAHPTLHNVAIFDLFDLLAYADSYALHPNRLRAEYGGATGDSHPNAAANAVMTQVFATNPGNFLDAAWAAFAGSGPHYALTLTVAPPAAQAAGCALAANPPGLSYPAGQEVELTAQPAEGWAFSQWSDGDPNPVKTVTMNAPVDLTATFGAAPALSLGSAADLDFGSAVVGDVAQLKDAWTLSNTGGGKLDGTVSVGAPFHVSADGGAPASSWPFSLGPGEAKSLTFDFAPFRTRRATQTISIASNGGDATRRATGLGVLPVVSVTASDPEAAEPAEPGEFSVSRSGGAGSPLVVRYTVSGTARNGVDYQRLTGTLTIPQGQLSAPIPVTPIDDKLAEPDETAIVTLSSRTTYTVDASQRTATVYIADNDPAPKPRLGIAATIPIVPEQGPGVGEFTISRLGGPDTAVTVLYTVAGTARNGSDYQRLSGSVLLPQGQAAVAIRVTPINDLRHESAEAVILTLRPSAAYSVEPAQRSAFVTILDND